MRKLTNLMICLGSLVFSAQAMAQEADQRRLDKADCLISMVEHLAVREQFDAELTECIKSGLISAEDVIQVGRLLDAPRPN